jgi:hypothetical protein
MIAATRRTARPNDLPPLVNGDHLDQKTFHERYEVMPPEVRAELIGGIVYMSPGHNARVSLRHGAYHLKLAAFSSKYADETPGTGGCVSATTILGPTPNRNPTPFSSFFQSAAGKRRRTRRVI